MVYQWEAEREISAEQAKKLVQDQFPLVQIHEIFLLGRGWDNVAYLINNDLIFRFPRRKIAVELIQLEAAILPEIAPFLPLPIPLPQYKGEPSDKFPWPFLGYQKLEGNTACQLSLSEAERARFAEPLGRFLSSLHAIPLSRRMREVLPIDIIGRLDVENRVQKIQENLKNLPEVFQEAEIETLLEIIEKGRPYKKPEESAVVHGDFYVRHLLLNNQHQLCGVIDWGDVHIGDPAIDLSIAHSFLPLSSHEAFRKAYGEIDEKTWELAKLRAIYSSSMLAYYAHCNEDNRLKNEAIVALERMIHSTKS